MLLGFACALLLLTATLYALRGGFATPLGLRVVGTDAQGVGLGAVSVLIAAWYFGPLYGLALILTVMIHEYGHVAAFRATGHADARFRLVPLMGGYAISDRAPETEAEDFFISLAGPALSLAPMVIAYTLSEVLAPVSQPVSKFLWVFAATTAALNFLNLLPLWPLDGGRCLRAITHAVHPRLATGLTLAMSAAFAAGALLLHSVLLFLVAMLGALTIRAADKASRDRQPMAPKDALLAFGAYTFTAAAHFMGGALLLAAYL
jgi:Zn-dependent protease